ncbi:TetR/AcrR family transcriptional regulator [Pelagibacterium xiamenense]|uniref:TetR/AcrR family transcriptional regulator n=1 Tax=Pelagibacterium xiamenense TaxID=2901140 RepID=UPI001E5B3350|nr:TetR/AcrR family transcriptional regulator [Pelagibacterium xiamenense]MCD7059088.1 TetR/AcrR family transcriptional regulator [Pelagibacterium xiamenense]
MQRNESRRSNKDRSDATRGALMAAGRTLFIARGYAEVGTPELVAEAGVTRGALYHHFADKKALFAAVVEAEAAAVAAEIDAATPAQMEPVAALVAGGKVYLDAMQTPGRTRLLLLEAPAVLGYAETRAIDERHADRTLREGLEAAIAAGAIRALPLDALTQILSAAFDRAAIAVSAGVAREDAEAVILAVVEGLTARGA